MGIHNICLPKEVRKKVFEITAAGVKCPLVGIKCIAVLHHSAVFILLSLGIIHPTLGKSSSA